MTAPIVALDLAVFADLQSKIDEDSTVKEVCSRWSTTRTVLMMLDSARDSPDA